MDEKLATVPARVAAGARVWMLFLAGVLLCVLGPALYVVQFRAKQLATPWYVPLLASVGAALMLASVWQRRGVVRAIGLVLFSALCGLEWFAIGVATRTPHYNGPAQPGRTLPQFTAARADGSQLSEKDFAQGTMAAVVFFRGRW